MFGVKRRLTLYVVAFLLVAILDICLRGYCKFFGCSVSVGPFGFELFRNYNIVFSLDIGLPTTFLLTGLIILTFVFFGIKYATKAEFEQALFYILIAGFGAINFFDRLVFGYVTDYIKIHNGYLNLADIGIVLLLLNVILKSSIWSRKSFQERL